MALNVCFKNLIVADKGGQQLDEVKIWLDR